MKDQKLCKDLFLDSKGKQMYNYLTPLEVGMSYEDVQVKQLGNGYELTKPLDVI